MQHSNPAAVDAPLFALGQREPVMQRELRPLRQSIPQTRRARLCASRMRQQQHRKQRSIHEGKDQHHSVEHAVESHCGARGPEGKQHAAHCRPSGHSKQPLVGSVAASNA